MDAARGAGRLAFEAVEQLTNIVEAMHANIAAVPAPLGKGTDGRTKGITRLVYSSIRGVNTVAKVSIDAALGLLGKAISTGLPQPHSDAVRAAVNGVLGDHLDRTENPLAIEMRLRNLGSALDLEPRALATAMPQPGGRILIAVHGLCMSDRQWLRNGHDHALALSQALGYTPLYLFYNSGRHISQNGRAFADLLERLVQSWPEPVEEMTIIVHSMGGLVTRSACHYGGQQGHSWLGSLERIVFLGTPHHGAPLERGGNWLQLLFGLSPYTAPLGRLGTIRSDGVTDLRHGNVLDEDWQARDHSESPRDPRSPVPLPSGVQCFAHAATLGKSADEVKGRALGDGLVPVPSALGKHKEAALQLAFPDPHQSVGYGMNHWDLLDKPSVYEQVLDWLGGSGGSS